MQSGRQTIDFFGEQDRARKRSRRLVLIYALAVILICGAVGGFAAFGAAVVGPLTEAGRGPSPSGTAPSGTSP